MFLHGLTRKNLPTAALRPPTIERLEARQLLAAHIVGVPGATYQTIQEAVDAAALNATIRVDAGMYEESVTVGKPLTLKGARAGVDARDGSRGTNETILRGVVFDTTKRSNSLFLAADDITIDGFTIQDQTGAAGRGAGVVIQGGRSGTRILNDIIQSNSSGLYLANASATKQALIYHNVFATNNNPGTNNGRGIYSDGDVSGGNLVNVVIDENTFVGNVGDGTSGNPEAAVGLEAQGAGKQSNITISDNVMDQNGKGVLVYNAANVRITGNTITNCTDVVSAAIRVEGNVKNLTVQNNTISDNDGAAIRISQRFPGLHSGIIIKSNNITKNAGGGLIVEPNSMSGALDARYNWWGSATGPSGDGPGTGQSVLANGNSVLFSPWLKSPVTTVPSPRTVPQKVLDFLKGLQTRLAASSSPVAQKLADLVGAILAYLSGAWRPR